MGYWPSRFESPIEDVGSVGLLRHLAHSGSRAVLPRLETYGYVRSVALDRIDSSPYDSRIGARSLMGLRAQGLVLRVQGSGLRAAAESVGGTVGPLPGSLRATTALTGGTNRIMDERWIDGSTDQCIDDD